MSKVKCRFTTCNWSGSCDDIFTHCEEHHRHCIKNLNDGNRYDFNFNDITHEAFLLCGTNGLYWFCLDQANESAGNVNMIKRGIFAIGDSEPIEYTLKLGLIRDGNADYLGPFTSHSAENVEIYDLEFPYSYIEFINEVMPSRSMKLYVGEYDDSDDCYSLSCDEVDWSIEKERAINQLCIEKFTCGICLEFIRRDARFCENQHFVCCKCFDEMVKRRKLKCPICRGDYLYDCQSDAIERLLRMVKFPEESGHAQDGSEKQQLLKSEPCTCFNKKKENTKCLHNCFKQII